jgi:type I restriction enzyme, S subunit
MTPEGWTAKPLGELISEHTSGYWGEVAQGENEVAVLRSTNLRNDGRLDFSDIARRTFPLSKIAQKRLLPGDILLERSGGGPKQPVGRVALFAGAGEFAFSNFMQRLRPSSDVCDSKFLLYELTRFHSVGGTEELQQATTGIRNLQYRDYLARVIALPPLAEQRKIATIISSVDDSIDATQTVIDQVQIVKKAMMAELLTRGLPGRHTRFKQTEIGEVPAQWEILPFERLLADGDALSYGILQPGGDEAGGVPMLRTVDLDEHGGRSGTEVVRVNAKIETAYTRTRLRGGEVLLSVMGTVGRTVVVPAEWRGWNVNRALAVIRLNDKAAASFLSFWLRSPSTQASFLVKQIGSAQKRINLGDLRQMQVPVPSADEQVGICETLAALEARQRTETQVLSAVQQAKSALMSVLLTGEVRVIPEEVAA